MHSWNTIGSKCSRTCGIKLAFLRVNTPDIHDLLYLALAICGCGTKSLFRIAVRNSGGVTTNAAVFGTASTQADPDDVLPD